MKVVRISDIKAEEATSQIFRGKVTRQTITGESEDQEEASAFLTDAFMLAIMLMFVVLVSQFSSVTVPVGLDDSHEATPSGQEGTQALDVTADRVGVDLSPGPSSFGHRSLLGRDRRDDIVFGDDPDQTITVHHR